MRRMIVLGALIVLAAYPTMGAAPIEKGAKELTPAQKQAQSQTQSLEKPAVSRPPAGAMVSIPAGEFTMGSQDGDSDERPMHKVQLNAFSIDVYEVTVGQYEEFLRSGEARAPLDWKTMNQSRYHKLPVANIDWADAVAYCKWAGKRLPTEAEWEKAARGTDGRLYPWGNDPPTPLHANYGKTGAHNYDALVPGGTLEAGKSPYGVYDMAGNVWEWVSDWYDQDYYTSSPSKNPTGPLQGQSKVIRGGSWGSGAKDLRSSDRDSHLPSARGMGTGFRCAKTP